MKVPTFVLASCLKVSIFLVVFSMITITKADDKGIQYHIQSPNSLLPSEVQGVEHEDKPSWWRGTTNLTHVIFDVLHNSAFITTKIVPSSLVEQLSALVWPSIYGTLMVLFTWSLIYYDSKVPGVYPPTPISPKKFRVKSGHTFHLGYTIGLINGIIVFVLSLWQEDSQHQMPTA